MNRPRYDDIFPVGAEESTVSRWQATHDLVFEEDSLRELDAHAVACMVHAGMWGILVWLLMSVAESFVWAIQ